jgi:hypothetical protein
MLSKSRYLQKKLEKIKISKKSIDNSLPNGKDVNAFSLIFNFDKYFASENIENGILSIVLHSILIECTDVNCVGPPNGNELKLFRANEMVFK